MKTFITCVLIGFTMHSFLQAQSSLDMATFSGRIGFAQQAGEPIAGNSTEYGALANIKIPVVFSNKLIWYNELSYVYSYVYNQADLPISIANPLQLHGLILQTGVIKSLGESTKIQLLLAPRFMSDGYRPNYQNVQWGAMALFEKKYKESLTMRYGFLYNTEEFGPSLTPLVYVNWQINEKWSMVGLVPITFKLSYQVHRNLVVGFSHFALITSYRLGHPNYQDDYIERSSIDLTLFARHRLWGNLHIEGRMGMAVDRYYEQYSRDQQLGLKLTLLSFGDNRVPFNTHMKTGPIANIRLVYNLPL